MDAQGGVEEASAYRKERTSNDERWRIPSSWAWVRMDQISDIVGGGTPKNAKNPDNFSDNGVPWITPADLSGYKQTYITRGNRSLSETGFSNSSAKLLPKGTVLFSSRAPIGYCVITQNEISTNQGFRSFVLNYAAVPEFVRHYLLASKSYVTSFASGTTFKELRGTSAAALMLPLAPLAEQHRIVSKIDELFSDIEAGERALARARAALGRYRKAVLKAAVTGELTAGWREANRDRLEPAEKLLTRILDARRAAWEKAERARLKARGKLPGGNAWKGKYREPNAAECKERALLPDSWIWVTGAYFYFWSSGDFLPTKKMEAGSYNVYGGNGVIGSHSSFNVSFPTIVVGRVGVHCGNVHLTHGPAWITDNAIYATVQSSQIIPEYAEIALRQLNLRQEAQGGAQPFVNQKALNEALFPIPGISEQQEIVSRLAEAFSKADHVEAALDEQERAAKALRQSILKAAFEGRLVPQDPNDEPAAKLLARIRKNGGEK